MQKQLIKRLFREKAPKRPDEYGNPAPTVPQLLPETCRCVSELIVKLASRAQYSKVCPSLICGVLLRICAVIYGEKLDGVTQILTILKAR